MLAQVIESDRPIGLCEECHRLFPMIDSRQRFCSTVCNKRVSNRRYREQRTRAGTSLAAEKRSSRSPFGVGIRRRATRDQLTCERRESDPVSAPYRL